GVAGCSACEDESETSARSPLASLRRFRADGPESAADDDDDEEDKLELLDEAARVRFLPLRGLARPLLRGPLFSSPASALRSAASCSSAASSALFSGGF